MSRTPPMSGAAISNGRDRTPEVTNKRESRHRDEDDRDDRDRHSSRRAHDEDDEEYERERERRHRRHREERERRERERERERALGRPEETEEERRERKRRHYDEETPEEREARRRRRYEREEREREYDDRRGSRDERRESRDHRDRSRDSHRSLSSRDPEMEARRAKLREEREAERERRDREMQEERRARRRDRDSYDSPLRTPFRNSPRPRRDDLASSAPPPDPAGKLLQEVDSESRSVFVSQLAARLTSQDLGLFFEDQLGHGAVRDARVVMDRGTKRSKGIGYVELDHVDLITRALGLSGTVVMGIPIKITLTESEKNHDGVDIMSIMAGGRSSQGIPRAVPPPTPQFPPLSTNLRVSQDIDIDKNRFASIPYHRLYVSNIAEGLSKDDVTQVFEAFGDIEFVDLHYDYSGHSKGTAYVQFKELRSAQMAVDAMDGFQLAGKPIHVIAFQERAQYERTEESRHGHRMDANARQQLMYKLARTDDRSAPAARSQAPAPKAAPAEPTRFLLVSNMFNPDEETERNWDLDLAEDVKGEVEAKYGVVSRIKVDKMSAGDVYIEFDTVRGSDAGYKGLNGRFFGGRKLEASFISETIFKAHL